MRLGAKGSPMRLGAKGYDASALPASSAVCDSDRESKRPSARPQRRSGARRVRRRKSNGRSRGHAFCASPRSLRSRREMHKRI